jgi:hypothetical protein
MSDAMEVARVADGEPAAAAEASPPLEWEVNAWQIDFRRAVLSLLGTFALWALLFYLRVPGSLGVILGGVVIAYLYPGFGSGRCRIDDQGVARKNLFVWERREWSRIRRARVVPIGLFVSPYAKPSRLDAYHGLVLPIPTRHPERDRLLGELRHRLASHGL